MVDEFGIYHITSDDLCDLLYLNPDLDISTAKVDNPEQFNQSAKELYYSCPRLIKYQKPDISVEDFDKANQSNWHMPESYKKFDIAKWALDQAKTEEELQRIGQELIMFQERGLIDLLRFMKYMVDIMREKNLVWGVGRGSSIASYVLFLIGVHHIDPIYYQLDINEFLK
jgi:DNA polymerase III alpha subunit